MSTKIATLYDTEATAITCTLASLADGNAREATAIDNSAVSPPYLDILIQVRIKTQAGTPGSDKKVYIYAAGTVDKTTPIWPDAVTGSDAGVTLNSPTQLKLIGVIEAPTASASFISEPMSLAQAFGGVVPEKWSIIVQNKTGLTLSATESDHKKIYQGIWGQSV